MTEIESNTKQKIIEGPETVTPLPPPEKPKEQRPKTNNSRSHLLWWFTGVLLVIAFAWFLYWLFYLRFHESTDDAFANGNMITINAAVPGSAIAFFADDTDLVEEGQLLVLLDRTDYQIAYERELATLASVVLQVRQFYDSVKVNQATVESKKVALERSKYDFDNRFALVGAKAVSGEDFIHARDALLTAQHDLEQAESQLNVAIAAAGNTVIEQHPLIEKQKGIVRTAFYNLEHCAIYAPATGYVAQRSVNVGQWVAQNTSLMAVIPKDYVWVDANFKETQLTYMRVGQPANVWFDMYGSKVSYKGKVLGIASGTGSVFSVIPPQNATGNWIKIVQRLPVRISLDSEQVEKFPTRLGISAEVNVDITDQNLPMLVLAPDKRPIGTTKVFDISLEKVDKLMDEIIRNNLAK